MTHVMLDLETWGKKPGCDIRSIGAAVFDPMNGAVNERDGEHHPSHFYIACDNPTVKPMAAPTVFRKYNLHRDPETVQWWSEQSAEAQAAFADPVDMEQALRHFADWLWNLAPPPANDPQVRPVNIRIWSHGPSFDVSILAAAYDAVNLPVPWHYRAPRA